MSEKLKGIKNDLGKPRLSLISSDFIEELGKVLTFGAEKYTANNWRGGFVWMRVMDAVLRHLFAWIRGEDLDPESGLSHLAHAVAGLMFLIEFQKRGTGKDDRFIYKEDNPNESNIGNTDV